MGLRFCFDQTLLGVVPIYDCDEDERALTWDRKEQRWVNSRTRENICRGQTGTSTERTAVAVLCDALIALLNTEKDGLVIIPWFWYDDEPVLSLLFFSNHEEVEEGDFPEWLSLNLDDHKSLLVGSVMFS